MLKSLNICPSTDAGKVKIPLETAKVPSDTPETIPKRIEPPEVSEHPSEGIKSWVASIRALIAAVSTFLSRLRARGISSCPRDPRQGVSFIEQG